MGIAVAAGSTYVPRCRADNSTLYDSCQCDIGDTRTLSVCWCADEQGNQLAGRIHQFSEEHWADVCLDKLTCEDTKVTRPPEESAQEQAFAMMRSEVFQQRQRAAAEASQSAAAQ